MSELTLKNIQERRTTGMCFEHKTLLNKDGSRLRARQNGKIMVWKTRPTEFRIPCKHGLRDYFYITQDNADAWEIV